MRNFTPDLIIEEVKNLISYSIINKDVDEQKFESLHSAVLKKYFDARDIKINYQDQTIDLNLSFVKAFLLYENLHFIYT